MDKFLVLRTKDQEPITKIQKLDAISRMLFSKIRRTPIQMKS